MVAAHGINGDLDHERPGIALLFGDFENFAVLVIAAMGTGAMRHPQFVTIRALGKRARGQMS